MKGPIIIMVDRTEAETPYEGRIFITIPMTLVETAYEWADNYHGKHDYS